MVLEALMTNVETSTFTHTKTLRCKEPFLILLGEATNYGRNQW